MKKILLFFIATIGMIACGSDNNSSVEEQTVAFETFTANVKIIALHYCSDFPVIELIDAETEDHTLKSFAVTNLPEEYQILNNTIQISYHFEKIRVPACPTRDISYRFITIDEIH
ncbi:hypothetical protein AB4865_01360 [Capnocytophaga sp. ARDL2]|uniref:hypothetical protein n=1 Tax=Capnocytophaga sp. ARDL2 TaxID=3238809 RepID=UPI003556B0C4